MNHSTRKIKSYVLRQGRLTKGQQLALQTQWPQFGIDYSETLLDINTLFETIAPVTLEIGFGNGNSLAQQALTNPDNNYLGIEVHRPGVGHLLHLVAENNMNNIRVSNHDAIEVLQHQIPDNSLARIQLFFPDPWHKKRHHKRRILQQSFIETLHMKLIDGGLFHMATDWQDYADHMQQEMSASKLFTLYSNERGERPLTKFEQRGLKLGHNVWDGIYRKQ